MSTNQMVGQNLYKLTFKNDFNSQKFFEISEVTILEITEDNRAYKLVDPNGSESFLNIESVDFRPEGWVLDESYVLYFTQLTKAESFAQSAWYFLSKKKRSENISQKAKDILTSLPLSIERSIACFNLFPHRTIEEVELLLEERERGNVSEDGEFFIELSLVVSTYINAKWQPCLIYVIPYGEDTGSSDYFVLRGDNTPAYILEIDEFEEFRTEIVDTTRVSVDGDYTYFKTFNKQQFSVCKYIPYRKGMTVEELESQFVQLLYANEKTLRDVFFEQDKMLTAYSREFTLSLIDYQL